MSAAIVVIGAGGHAAVLADALLAAGKQVLGFTDLDAKRRGSLVCGLPVLGDDAVLNSYSAEAVVLVNGIGSVRDPTVRHDVQRRLQARGWRFSGVRHPAAVASAFARIGSDSQLLAASVVNPGAQLGEGCIVNTAAVVEHDVKLDDWVHVAPRAVVCGDVSIGARSHIGAGAVVRQGLRLGPGTTVAAGAVVVKDFVGGGVLVGVPARPAEPRT